MSIQQTKRIGRRPIKKQPTNTELLRDTWQMMKPFVHFSIRAMRVIAHAMIFIIKNIPKPEDHKPKPKDKRVVKI